jgi:hypothetical protein
MTPSISEKELLREARRRFAEAESAEAAIREEARQDLQFLTGDQWPPEILQARIAANRPALVMNRLPVFVSQTVNSMRENRPGIKIAAVEQADEGTSDVLQGLIRHIEYDSDAQVAYQTGFQYAVSGSFGAYRIATRYVSESSFDQELRIEAIPDPFAVYMDPMAIKFDRSDARYAFVVEYMHREEYRREYPNTEAVAKDFWGGENTWEGWFQGETVRLAEYWFVSPRKRTLLQLSNRETAFQDEVDVDLLEGTGITVEDHREVTSQEVHSVLMNGAEVLEWGDREKSQGTWIPIIPVLGNEVWLDGQRYLYSLIRFARDPQQRHNFYKTCLAEAVQLAPKAPFIGAAGQFENFEEMWRTANNVNYPYLEYNPITVGGQAVPAPQRNTYNPPIQALVAGAMQAADDIKAVTGIFDPSLGAQSNEVSGKAILARQTQADQGTFHFEDNFARSQRHAGRVILDRIPHIYDQDRWVRIIGDDEAQRIVRLNAEYGDEHGRPQLFDLAGAGKYDVTVSTGPSFPTRKKEAFAWLTELARSLPEFVRVAGDIMFQHSDLPGADQLAERWRKTLPPEYLDEDELEEGQAKAQVAQLTAQVTNLLDQLQEASGVIQGKQIEADSRERIAALNAYSQLVRTEMDLSSREGTQILQSELGRIRKMIEDLFQPGTPAEASNQLQPGTPAEGRGRPRETSTIRENVS